MRLALLVALGVVACNPYDPNLGDQPFLCGTEEPRCPEGYVGVEVSATRCECLRAESVMDGGLTYECSQDSQEPNDSVARPWPTLVGEMNPSVNYPLASICPAGDEDFFQIAVPRRGTIIRADVMFDITRQAPDVAILDAQGVVQNAATASPSAGQLVTTFTAQAVDSYLVRVRSSQMVNYNIVQLRIIVPGI